MPTEPQPISSIRVSHRKTLIGLCEEYREISEQTSALAAAKKALMSDIRTIAETNHVEKVAAGDWTLSKCTRSTTSISGEKLLEKGVDMDIIDAATVVSTSSFYRVTGRG